MSLELIHYDAEISNDPERRLVAYTRSGWPITVPRFSHSDRIPSKEHDGLVEIRTAELVDMMKENKKRNLKVLSTSEDEYNCVGMIFCSRSAKVDIKHVDEILRHDGYDKIQKDEVVAGDLVLYTFENKFSHIGMVSCVSSFDLRVVSKWGKDGEVEHEFREVPFYLGVPAYFYTTRAKNVTVQVR
ncbi:MAG: hypothetical protein OXG60_10645 [Chloroflexi bacterium]|nr:hypothetical protein [Chloroflexota bacterium]